MKLRVGDRACRTTHVVAIHPQHKTDEAACARESPLNVWMFARQRRTIHFHKTDVIRTRVEAQLPQPPGAQQFGNFWRLCLSRANCGEGGMFVDRRVHKSESATGGAC